MTVSTRVTGVTYYERSTDTAESCSRSNGGNDNDFLSIALFHVTHALLG